MEAGAFLFSIILTILTSKNSFIQGGIQLLRSPQNDQNLEPRLRPCSILVPPPPPIRANVQNFTSTPSSTTPLANS